MPDNLEKITTELQALGYSTELTESPKGKVVSFDYQIDVGSLEGKTVKIGLSMQGEEPYPEYPPHWIHVSPPVDDGRGGVVERYTDGMGTVWAALSRPPGSVWDKLPTKHISAYISDHLRRFWNNM